MKSNSCTCRSGSLRTRTSGVSLVEILTTVGVIGVLTAIGLVVYKEIWDDSKAVIAEENAERLNSAVWKYNQIRSLISIAGDNSASSDEAEVLALLQTRDAIKMPGSPYLSTNVSFAASNDDDDFRLLWNGRAFQLAEPGTAGAGIKMVF